MIHSYFFAIPRQLKERLVLFHLQIAKNKPKQGFTG